MGAELPDPIIAAQQSPLRPLSGRRSPDGYRGFRRQRAGMVESAWPTLACQQDESSAALGLGAYPTLILATLWQLGRPKPLGLNLSIGFRSLMMRPSSVRTIENSFNFVNFAPKHERKYRERTCSG